MRCPKCPDSALRALRQAPDLEVDVCDHCDGIWLDKNEIYRYVRRPGQIYKELLAAYKAVSATRYRCPRCPGKALMQATIPAARIVIEACAQCGGNWFDAMEIKALNKALDQAASPMEAKESAEEEFRPRQLTQDEIIHIAGTGVWAQAGFWTLLASGLLAPLLLAGSDLVRSGLTVAGIYFAIWMWLSRRRRYIAGGLLVPGTILAYEKRHGTQALIRFSYEFEGSRHEATQWIDTPSPMDRGEGGRVHVVANSKAPGRALAVGLL